MEMRGHKLGGNIGRFKRLSKMIGVFVFKDMNCWLFTMVLESIKYCLSSFNYIFCMSGLDGDSICTICVIVV